MPHIAIQPLTGFLGGDGVLDVLGSIEHGCRTSSTQAKQQLLHKLRHRPARFPLTLSAKLDNFSCTKLWAAFSCLVISKLLFGLFRVPKYQGRRFRKDISYILLRHNFVHRFADFCPRYKRSVSPKSKIDHRPPSDKLNLVKSLIEDIDLESGGGTNGTTEILKMQYVDKSGLRPL